MAAEYLLDVYSVVRILLVVGTSSFEERSARIWIRSADYRCYPAGNARKQSGIWCAYPDRKLYASADSHRKVPAKNPHRSRACRKLSAVPSF